MMEGQDQGVNPGVSQGISGAIDPAHKSEVITTDEAPLTEVKIPKKAYIQVLIAQMQQAFNELSGDLNLGFVKLGEWISMTATGEFVIHNTKNTGEPVKIGRSFDAIIAGGEARWSLWGAQGTECWGQQIIDVPFEGTATNNNKDLAIAAYRQWAQALPELAAEQEKAENGEDHIMIRYRAVVVPVALFTDTTASQVVLSPEDLPKIYLMSFSPDTTNNEFSPWVRKVMLSGDKAKGIRPMTQPSNVIVRMSSKPKNKDGQNWISVAFDSVGPFNPEEFGLPKELNLISE